MISVCEAERKKTLVKYLIFGVVFLHYINVKI